MRWGALRGAQIIQVNLTSENPQPIVPGVNVEFSYAVRWAPTPTPFPRRFERYLDYNFFEHQVRLLAACAPLVPAPSAGNPRSHWRAGLCGMCCGVQTMLRCLA